MQEIIVDSFAGGGGASTGIEAATGRPVDYAINHDPVALAMYLANHPHTHVFCESVWDVDPRKVAAGRPVGLAWFSPDCKHFSKAKGGCPVEKNIRGLAWVVLKWAGRVRPRVIILENVEEFQTWGPLIPMRDKKTGRIIKGVRYVKEIDPRTDSPEEVCKYIVADPGEVVPVEDQIFVPDKKRAGQTFEKWKDQLKSLGYHVEHRELRACDYGAPTIRKRFFLIARCDGLPIVWPEPTHGDPNSEAVKSGKLLPWRTAAECIDWSIPCPSIFERKRPLAENTMKRIARGIFKFVINNPRPFIVQVNHTGSEGFRGQEVDDPLQTITGKNGWGVVSPTLMVNNTGHPGSKPDTPLSTVTTGGHHALVAPYLVGAGGPSYAGKPTPADAPMGTLVTENHKALIAPVMMRDYTKSTAAPVDDPLGTVTAKDKSELVAAFLQKYHGQKSDTDTRGQIPGEPIKTLDTSNRFGLVIANLAKHYGGGYTGPGSGMDQPVPTVTTVDHNALVTSHLLKLRGTCKDGQPVDDPAPTITAGGLHIGEVRAFLLKYYSSGTIGQKCDDPLHTVTTKDRIGLVTIQGVDYQIVDIGMRMLRPRELFRAQGFEDSYIIEHDAQGKPLSQALQVKMCGNSVPPVLAKCLVKANLPDMCEAQDTERIEVSQ